MQDKSKEIAFFDQFSSAKEYDVLTNRAYKTIIREYLSRWQNREGASPRLSLSPPGQGEATIQKLSIIDLGCGTGTFTRKFKEVADANFYGLDISLKSIELAAGLAPKIHFCTGDIENCCFKDESFDIVLFSGVLHHFSNFDACLKEGFRLLKKNGCVLSYDPNIKNPVMWLYRHPSSPLFSQKGKTENEQLLSKEQVTISMEKAGFSNIVVQGKSGITFKYIESAAGRILLPFYNLFEILLGISPLASRYGSFLIGYGEKT
ncbi:MAG: class I SAM-dependent methyltransferase [bacterium]|nr:class I SAM-dependent methyltransferase [bacterium]